MMKMNVKSHLRESFYRIKPLCDSVMIKPTPERIAQFVAMVPTVNPENLQDLQQYILFPFITHIKSAENERKYDLLIQIIDAMTLVLKRIKVTIFDVAMKVEIGLLSIVFDRAKLGMVAEVPEELKLSVMKCLTALMLGATDDVKLQILKTQLPVLAQAVFVSVHIAKLERMRALRLASIECLSAHTMSHRDYADSKMYLKSAALNEPTADYLASILPGVLAALQDVAMCKDNPGHAVIVAALDTIHRVLCITMNNKRLKKKPDVSLQDFTTMIVRSTKADKDMKEQTPPPPPVASDPSSLDVPSEIPAAKRSRAWYLAAGEKLLLVTKSLAPLVTHEHYLVRRELAVLSSRIVRECCETMPSSVPLALDILITLSKDEYKEVSTYCSKAVNSFFNKSTRERRIAIMDGVCENFFVALSNLPRVLNNIDSSRKLSALNLVRGYIEVLCGQERPQRLTLAVSAPDRCDMVCDALVAAAAMQYDLTMLTKQQGRVELTTAPVSQCPWLQLRHLECGECQRALQNIIQLLASAECCELLLDRLLELFHERRDCELVYIMNWMGSAPNAPKSLARRIIKTYIEEDIWYLPLDIDTNEKPLSKADTLDPSVYNPRAWVKDTVPGLYEGTTEVRYTDISYQHPRAAPPAADTCRSLAQSQRNLAMSCLLTEALGGLAHRLGEDYQPFLLKTLCLVLERVGSKYEILHRSGTKTLLDIAAACGQPHAAALVARNVDYFTSQISSRLKKAWDVQSALQILTVVMTYSDTSILEYLYATIEDVLVQSCDKYHRKNLFAYLQVFECFVYCIHHWFYKKRAKVNPKTSVKDPKDCLKDFKEHIENTEEVERLLNTEEFEQEMGKSAEEMYREDMKKREEDEIDYDDTVTKESPPLPKHVTVTVTVLKRAIHFVGAPERDESNLAMHILLLGFPILREYEDELLPLIHQCWTPFVSRLLINDPLVMRKAFELLVVMADVSKEFIRSRAVKDVFPKLFKFLSLSATDSYLKDNGAAYRLSAAYSLQVSTLTQLPFLVQDLALTGPELEAACGSVAHYLRDRQPRKLQFLAVQFFKLMLRYDYCATWFYLRGLCDNKDVIQPPAARYVQLQPLVGTPYRASKADIDANIRQIFEVSLLDKCTC